MQKLQFPIVAIPYGDYGSRLEEVRELAAGTPVMLKPDPGNPADRRAVKACIGMEHLGYVKVADGHNALALSCIGGRRGIRCRLLRTEEEHMIVWVETEQLFDPERLTAPEPACKPFLSDWSYDGPLLPLTTEEKRLQDARDNQIIMLSETDPAEQAMGELMAYLEEWAWLDVSEEAKNDLKELSDLLFEQHKTELHDRVQHLLAVQVTPAMRTRQLARLREAACSRDAAIIAKAGDCDLSTVNQLLPQSIRMLADSDPGLIFSQLWYAPKPQVQVRALRTLLCLKMYLETATTTATSTTSVGICPYIVPGQIKSPEQIDSELRQAAGGKASELVGYVKRALMLGYINFGGDNAKTIFETLKTYYTIRYGYHNWLKYYGK